MQNDTWSWVNEYKPAAPLSASIQPSQEQTPGIQVSHDPTTQYFNQLMLGKGIDATANGISAGIKAYGAPLSATTQAVGSLGEGAALTNAGASAIPSSIYALTPTLTAAPVGGSGLGIGTGAAAVNTASASAAPAAATTAGLGAAGAAAGEGALAAMGPVGWAIGAGLLAKRLGIF